MINSDIAVDPANFWAEINRAHARIDALETARRLAASRIDEGGLIIGGGADMVVEDGGGVRIQDGGQFRADYPSGSPAAWFGAIKQGDLTPMYGLLMQLDDGDPNVPSSGTDFMRLGLDVTSGRGAMVAGLVAAPMISAAIVADVIWLITPETTTSSANCYIDVNGHLRLVTSPAGSKVDIGDVEAAPADVLALRPRVWRDRGQVERGERADPVFGFIADEVAVLPGLGPLVGRDEAGAPITVAYDRVPAAQQIVLRDHEARLAAAEARAEAAETKLAALEARLAALEGGT